VAETYGVAIARIEERLRELREDVSVLVAESERNRRRLHNLEGFQGAYLDTQKQNRRQEESQYRRLEIRLQVLTLVIALAAVLTPLITILVLGK
jgi:hypothetical protein